MSEYWEPEWWDGPPDWEDPVECDCDFDPECPWCAGVGDMDRRRAVERYYVDRGEYEH